MEAEQYQTAFYEIAKKVNSSLAPQGVLDAIVESVARATGAKGCSLMLLTPDRSQLVHSVDYGLSEWYVTKGPIIADSILSEALQGKPVAVLHAAEDPRIQYPEHARKEGIASMLTLPLMLRDEPMGVLRIYTSEPQEFTPQYVEFVSTAADLGAIALEKAQLHESLGEKYESKVGELEEVTNELKKLEQERERFLRFLSIAAHDLKAPLSAIQSYLQVMLGGFVGEFSEKQENMLERSSYRITELLNLISDLLDIARIETGQLVQEMKRISVIQVAENSVDSLRHRAEQKGIRLVTNIPKSLPLIRASSAQLDQALTNLVDNAINYSPPGSEVTVVVEKGEGDIVVSVLDEGIGIPPKDLPHVFDDFFRASNVEITGTGLGLPIVKRIVEAHGGRIWVESPCPGTDKGSKFTFTLPKDQRPSKAKGEARR